MCKRFFALAFAACIGVAAYACEVCGCSSGGTGLGILPQYHKHFIGLRYSFRSFHTNHPPSIIPGMTGQRSDEFYQSLELWARFYPTKRLQVFAFVPVNFYTQNIEGVTGTVNTIGDISVMANYIIWQTQDTLPGHPNHLLQGGAGVKMPTGRYDLKDASGELFNPNMQPGSGSWDVLFNVAYTVRWKKWGINSEALYRLNTVNPAGYQFGDKVSASVKGFYAKEWNGFTLLPSVGAVYEHTFANRENHSRVAYTGGDVLSVHAGVDLYWKRFSFGISTQVPCWQNMSAGYVTVYPRANAQFLFLF